MTEAYIFDAVRTPRGKGKKDGALYSVKPVDLVVGLLKALEQRNRLDTAQVDDVVLGCVTPVGDQGADIAKTAVLAADWAECVAGVQLNRFCASGLEAVNMGAMKVRSGFEDLVVVGGVESMSRIPMGSDGGAWAMDPATNMHTNFVPQGVGADLIATLEGFSRTEVDSFALRSQQKAARASADGSFAKSLIPVTDQNGIVLLDRDEFIRGDSTLEGLGKLKPSFEMMGQMGFDASALRKYSHVERIEHVHTPGNSSGIVDGAALMLIGSEAKGKELGLKPRARRRYRGDQHRSDHHAHRPGAGHAQGAGQGRPVGGGHRPVRGQRGVRLGGDEVHEGHGRAGEQGQRQRRLHRHGPPAGRHWLRHPRHPARRAGEARAALRPGHPLRGWRHGYCDHHRANLRAV